MYSIDIEGGALNVIATIDSSSSGDIAASALLNVCAVGKEVPMRGQSPSAR